MAKVTVEQLGSRGTPRARRGSRPRISNSSPCSSLCAIPAASITPSFCASPLFLHTLPTSASKVFIRVSHLIVHHALSLHRPILTLVGSELKAMAITPYGPGGPCLARSMGVCTSLIPSHGLSATTEIGTRIAPVLSHSSCILGLCECPFAAGSS